MNYPIKLNENRLQIFHETKKRRVFVGELIYDKKKDIYELIYDKNFVASASLSKILRECVR